MIIEEYLKANHPSLYKEEKKIDTDRIIKAIISTNTYAKKNLILFNLKERQSVKSESEMLYLIKEITRQFSYIQKLLEDSRLIEEMPDRGTDNPVGKLLTELPEDFIAKTLRSDEFKEYELKDYEIGDIKYNIERIYRSYCVYLYTRSPIDANLIIDIMESEHIIFKSYAKKLYAALKEKDMNKNIN